MKPGPCKPEADRLWGRPVATVESNALESICSLQSFSKSAVNGFRHILTDDFLPTYWTDQAFDHAGADLGNAAWRHHKDGADARIQVAVDVPHCAFKLVVALS